MSIFDDEGFVVNFDISQKLNIMQFFDTYGFVVISNVLDDDEIQETIDDYFSLLDGGINASDEELEQFYATQPFGQFGIIGEGPDLKSLSQLNNRQNPKVYEAFSLILNSRELIVEHDRLGVLRPTFRESGEKVEWRTRDRWVHLDCNPLTGTASIGGFKKININPIDFKETLIVQGLITLTDARVEDGGFHCIPGGHKLAHTWAKGKISMQLEPDDPIRDGVTKIPIRAGCLLVWNTLLFHGNHPNFSSKWRIVQYIRMLPNKGTPYAPLAPEMKYYPIPFSMSLLGKKLFGIEPY